jgi:hypothetical protein
METKFNLEFDGLILRGYQSCDGLSLTIKSGVPKSEEEITKMLISLAHSMQNLFPMEAKKEKGLTIGLYFDESDEAYDCRVRCRVGRGDEKDSWTYRGELTIKRYTASCDIYTGDYYSENIYFNENCRKFGPTIEFSRPFGETALPDDADF